MSALKKKTKKAKVKIATAAAQEPLLLHDASLVGPHSGQLVEKRLAANSLLPQSTTQSPTHTHTQLLFL